MLDYADLVINKFDKAGALALWRMFVNNTNEIQLFSEGLMICRSLVHGKQVQ
jgi:hypothetical protein